MRLFRTDLSPPPKSNGLTDVTSTCAGWENLSRYAIHYNVTQLLIIARPTQRFLPRQHGGYLPTVRSYSARGGFSQGVGF